MEDSTPKAEASGGWGIAAALGGFGLFMVAEAWVRMWPWPPGGPRHWQDWLLGALGLIVVVIWFFFVPLPDSPLAERRPFDDSFHPVYSGDALTWGPLMEVVWWSALFAVLKSPFREPVKRVLFRVVRTLLIAGVLVFLDAYFSHPAIFSRDWNR